MSSYRNNRKKDVDNNVNIYRTLDKTVLIQEVKYFNSTSVDYYKCIHILKKLIYFLYQGDINLSTQEATSIFFATTKLFQSKNIMLRRLVYLCIKELSSMAQDVIIVTSSLIKDMTGTEDLYRAAAIRAAAIRALYSITDLSMIQAIERYMKQAIVDKNHAVSSAALVSALHLSSNAPDLVHCWVNEAQEAISSENPMVSYHAFAVVALSKHKDHLAIVKLVTKLMNASLRSPYALCILIRHAAQLVEENQTASEKNLQFIESCLRHKEEFVVYEAAHAIVNLRKNSKDLAQTVSVLQKFCSSSKATLRLAGVRTLSKLATKVPNTVETFAVDLKNLISDPNRSVATLAITTLLTTGAESSVDRLLKQISKFMSEISDEFKIVVVSALKFLGIKYPHKHQVLSSFLAGMLRDNGGEQYKTAITDAIIGLVEENPEARESCLEHLCEYIEDCEYASLTIHILHVLGSEGTKVQQPSRFIRYIYNRIILESGAVRAAAVSTVARFGAAREELLPNVKVLLARCELDDDDEVRDRAILYNAVLESGDQQLFLDFITNVQVPNPIILEKELNDHITVCPEKEFDISMVPNIECHKHTEEIMLQTENYKQSIISLEEKYADQLKIVPGIDKLGPLFKTSDPCDLTEAETEYYVSCVKHVYAKHLVLQFDCLNTLNDQLLEKVYIHLQPVPEYKILCEVQCEQLPFNKQQSVFCVLEFPKNPIETLVSFRTTMEFIVHDCNPVTGFPESSNGYADTYPLENVEIGITEQFRIHAASSDWDEHWNSTTNFAETCDTFSIPQNNINEAAIAVCKHLGIRKSSFSGDSIKEICGEGLWREGIPMLVQAKLVSTQGAITMQLIVKSPREDIATLVLAAIG